VDSGQPACDIEEMETTRVSFTVNSFDADAFGHLTPPALAGYLQESAGRSATALGWSLAELNRRGLTWVLVRERLALDEPLRVGDPLEVETWPSGLDRLAAMRDFRIRRGGLEVGRALTSWLALDLATRRPVRPSTILPERFHAQTAHVLPTGAAPLPALGEASIDRRFQVRYADIDANLHVTHASYLSWALEAVDEATWRGERVSALDVQFLAECNLGAFVRSRSTAEVAGVRLHAIVREQDGRELARARTTWAPRER
jgi:acyl-ACP thioesterase